jgi:hypothetical protein
MDSEKLACWYFRLNGFLISQNYIIHSKDGSGRTEIDIIGVRFPYKAEKIEITPVQFVELEDEQIFKDKKKINIIIAEAKKGLCCLNSSLTTAYKHNMQRVLETIGVIEEKDLEDVANTLYVDGLYENESYCISLICIGESKNYSFQRKYLKLKQITWCEVLEFIYDRFEKYKHYKRQHDQWDCDGKQLWNCFKCNTKSKFKKEIISCLDRC